MRADIHDGPEHCSNRRPNTLTQDRINQRRQKPLAPRGRTIHLGQTLPSLPARLKSGLAHEANIKGETQHVSEGHEETFHCVPHT